jgi:hypothetical protein
MKFIFKAETLITKVSNIRDIHGNLLAIFSPLIGNSFSKSTVTVEQSCTKAINSNEIKAHRFFGNLTEILFGKLNLTISLFDIPTLVSAITPRRMLEYTYKDLFPFTQCQEGTPFHNRSNNMIKLTDCVSLWDLQMKKQSQFVCHKQNLSYADSGINVKNKFKVEFTITQKTG